MITGGTLDVGETITVDFDGIEGNTNRGVVTRLTDKGCEMRDDAGRIISVYVDDDVITVVNDPLTESDQEDGWYNTGGECL